MRPNVGDWIYTDDSLPKYGTPVYAACRAKDGSRENWVAGVPFYGYHPTTKNEWGVPILDSPKYEVYAWMGQWWPNPPKER